MLDDDDDAVSRDVANTGEHHRLISAARDSSRASPRKGFGARQRVGELDGARIVALRARAAPRHLGRAPQT